jgi:hypothetical protein
MITTRQGLADYALRQLGAPVINIEVADSQLADAVNDSIEMFQEYHPDGIARDYVKHKLVMTAITCTDASLINLGDVISTTLSSGIVKEKTGNIVSIQKTNGPMFAVGNTINFTAGTTLITAVSLGDADNGFIPIGNDIVGVLRVLPWQPSFGDGLFDITYQLRMNDLRNLSGGNMSYFTSSMEYLSMLDFFLRKEKQFRFNRRMGNLYLDVDWNTEVNEGTYFVIEVLRIVDDTTYTSMYNDIWLKRYVTAKIKHQWGNNLRKYSNVALPGGVTLNGENIMAEAKSEIDDLKAELINNMAPLSFMIG